MATDSKHTQGILEHHPYKPTIIGFNMDDPINSASLCEVFGPTPLSFHNAARIVECWNQHDQLKEENKTLKDLCNEMLGEFDRLRKTYDNVEDLAGVIARAMYDKANTILSPSNTESNEKE